MPKRKKQDFEEIPEPDFVGKPILRAVAKWVAGIVGSVITAVVIYLLIGTPTPPQPPPKGALVQYDDIYPRFRIKYPSYLGHAEQYQNGDTLAAAFGLERVDQAEIRKEGLVRAIWRPLVKTSGLLVVVYPPLTKDVSFDRLLLRNRFTPANSKIIKSDRDSMRYYSAHKRSSFLASTYWAYLLMKGNKSGRILKAWLKADGGTWSKHENEIFNSFMSIKLERFTRRDSTARLDTTSKRDTTFAL